MEKNLREGGILVGWENFFGEGGILFGWGKFFWSNSGGVGKFFQKRRMRNMVVMVGWENFSEEEKKKK